MYSCASLKRSATSIHLLPGIQRLNYRFIFNQAEVLSSSSSSSSSSLFAASSIKEDKWGDSGFGFILKAVTGFTVGSGLGFSYWYSSSSSTTTSADYSTVTKTTAEEDPHPQHHSSIQDAAEGKKSWYLFGDAFRRRVFFNYEKRIRMRSPPEKVFEYFASFRTPGGEVFMTPADLMRAVVPVFPPSESNLIREGYLRGERSPGELRCETSNFFMLFDTNNDGFISFAEYIFLVTLLSIPEYSFAVVFKMFDLDHNGEIDREEFKKVMALMRAYNRQGVHHRNGRRTGFKVGTSVENGGLLEYFFGKDGNARLPIGKFVEFLRNLHDEILRLEFAHYDYKLRGTISAKDFALSMVASADMSHINKFLDRVELLNNEPHLRNIRITFEEFKDFAELRKKLQPLSLAIFGYGKVNGLLTRKDFQRAASHVCGVNLTDNVVDIIFHMFDTNCDGKLSTQEFFTVLEKREKDIGQPTESGFMGLISCWLSCSKSRSLA
ncbi:calcium uptake protein, mitochondrial-like [Macadamia integrifolia]|uniref:calcium uptake protein, mitochondrial-like n=1 Tax=Macadamia integrifolia TaxID=60698 RepID=UPI001C4F3DC7|nr:calcium uptake protein, mitochondrial-like [Macadamia integrifolia]